MNVAERILRKIAQASQEMGGYVDLDTGCIDVHISLDQEEKEYFNKLLKVAEEEASHF